MENIIDALGDLITPIQSLLNDPANARTGHDIDGIAASLAKYGQRTPIVVNKKTNIVLKGNGTLKAAKSLNWQKIAVVYVDDDDLTATGYSIADNRLTDLSVFDTEALSSLLDAMDDPLDVPGIDEKFLESLNFDGIGGSDSEEKADENYSRKVEAPTYEPKNDKPLHNELFDIEKYNKIIQEIDASGLSKEDLEFLKFAATRHIIFNYEKIADYYAHSKKDVQKLMEDSALIIIDFDKAIELGYVKLSAEITKQYKRDYPNER